MLYQCKWLIEGKQKRYVFACRNYKTILKLNTFLSWKVIEIHSIEIVMKFTIIEKFLVNSKDCLFYLSMYKILIGFKLDQKRIHLPNWLKCISMIKKGKDFLNNFGVSSFKFYEVNQILSSTKSQKISLSEGKNGGADWSRNSKIQIQILRLLGAFFCPKTNNFVLYRNQLICACVCVCVCVCARARVCVCVCVCESK